MSKYEFIADEITGQIEKIKASRLETSQPLDFPLDGSHSTNLDLFIKYLRAYLKSRQDLHQRRLITVVQTSDPGRDGIAVQIFTYTKATGWIEHAAVRDEIMIHLLAAAPYFDLRVFQDPTDIELVTMDSQKIFD